MPSRSKRRRNIVDYAPPPMNRRVTLRNPDEAPLPSLDGTTPDWGTEVWAHRRDRSPFTEHGEGVEFLTGRIVWTIHYMAGVSPTTFVVDSDGVEYVPTGPPVQRGGEFAGMLATYLELHTERRSVKGTPAEAAR